MPLFECSQCHCIDNSALTNFWCSLLPENALPLCSECDPQIGEWHGRFKKRPFDSLNGVDYSVERVTQIRAAVAKKEAEAK